MKVAPARIGTALVVTVGVVAVTVHAQIPVVGGPVDFLAEDVARRCVAAGVPNEEVPVMACVSDAQSRVWESLGTHADHNGYIEAMSHVNVALPVVVKDSRTFANSISGRLPVSGALVMRAGKTCAWQQYSIGNVASGNRATEPQIETEQGTFLCDKDGVALPPPL